MSCCYFSVYLDVALWFVYWLWLLLFFCWGLKFCIRWKTSWRWDDWAIYHVRLLHVFESDIWDRIHEASDLNDIGITKGVVTALRAKQIVDYGWDWRLLIGSYSFIFGMTVERCSNPYTSAKQIQHVPRSF